MRGLIRFLVSLFVLVGVGSVTLSLPLDGLAAACPMSMTVTAPTACQIACERPMPCCPMVGRMQGKHACCHMPGMMAAGATEAPLCKMCAPHDDASRMADSRLALPMLVSQAPNVVQPHGDSMRAPEYLLEASAPSILPPVPPPEAIA